MAHKEEAQKQLAKRNEKIEEKPQDAPTPGKTSKALGRLKAWAKRAGVIVFGEVTKEEGMAGWEAFKELLSSIFD